MFDTIQDTARGEKLAQMKHENQTQAWYIYGKDMRTNLKDLLQNMLGQEEGDITAREVLKCINH